MAHNDYFGALLADERLLRSHGFDGWPDGEQLARCLMDTNDKIDILCNALGIELGQDCRGRWVASNIRREVER